MKFRDLRDVGAKLSAFSGVIRQWIQHVWRAPGKLFGRNAADEPSEDQPRIRKVQASMSGLRFLGEPHGEALGLLQDELGDILRAEGNTRRAYLSRVQYPEEDHIRIAIVIDGGAPAEQMAKPIATACVPLVSINLLFFEQLRPEQVADLEQGHEPFYEASK